MTTQSELTHQVKLPSQPDLHWRYLQILLAFRAGEIDVDRFRESLPSAPGEGSWIAAEGPDSQGHTHVRLSRADVPSTEAPPGETPETAQPSARRPEWLLELNAYRRAPVHGLPSEHLVPHELVFESLDAASHVDEFIAICSAALIFSADAATWRPSLLAEPQELTDIGAELGAITLAGLTLRFKGAVPGLLEARLEVSPDESEYLTDLRFSYLLSRSALPDAYSVVLTKAERYATLFIKSTE